MPVPYSFHLRRVPTSTTRLSPHSRNLVLWDCGFCNNTATAVPSPAAMTKDLKIHADSPSLSLRDSKQKPPTLSSSSSKVALIVASAALVITKRSFLSSSLFLVCSLLLSPLPVTEAAGKLSPNDDDDEAEAAQEQSMTQFFASLPFISLLSRAPPPTTKRQKKLEHCAEKIGLDNTHVHARERDKKTTRTHRTRLLSLARLRPPRAPNPFLSPIDLLFSRKSRPLTSSPSCSSLSPCVCVYYVYVQYSWI